MAQINRANPLTRDLFMLMSASTRRNVVDSTPLVPHYAGNPLSSTFSSPLGPAWGYQPSVTYNDYWYFPRKIDASNGSARLILLYVFTTVTADSSFMGITAGGGGFSYPIGVNSSGQPYCQFYRVSIGGGTITGTSVLTPGVHALVEVCRSNTVELWVDGTLVASETLYTSANYTTLGYDPSSNWEWVVQDFYTKTTNQVVMPAWAHWNRTLSQSEAAFISMPNNINTLIQVDPTYYVGEAASSPILNIYSPFNFMFFDW